jgi:hypothetical protein
LAFEDDLLFAPRIETGLLAHGYQLRFVTRISDLSEELKASPVLVLANLSSRGVSWKRMVEVVKARRLPPIPAVVGYGPHVDLALRQRALDAGCDAVVGRSAIVNSLGSLLQRHAWQPDKSVCERSLPADVRKGVAQFNRRAFFRCHDSIELAWVDEPGDIRLMYQGLLQISVAFYHVQRQNWRGMVKMLARGKGKLLPFLPACQGVELEVLLADVERCEAELRSLGPERLADFETDLFPTIALVDAPSG